MPRAVDGGNLGVRSAASVMRILSAQRSGITGSRKSRSGTRVKLKVPDGRASRERGSNNTWATVGTKSGRPTPRHAGTSVLLES